MDSIALLVSSKGRIGRTAFWLGWLMLIGVVGLCSTVPLFGWLAAIPTLYGFACVSSKRLHDMGVSGWLASIPIVTATAALVGILGGSIELLSRNGPGPFMLTGLASAIIAVTFLIWMGVTVGEPGDNRYGSPAAAPRFN